MDSTDERQLRRSVHRSTKELKADVGNFIEHHNQDPEALVWHETAGHILNSIATS